MARPARCRDCVYFQRIAKGAEHGRCFVLPPQLVIASPRRTWWEYPAVKRNDPGCSIGEQLPGNERQAELDLT